MYISFTGRSNFEFEVDQDAQGVILSAIKPTALIKVEKISDTEGDLTILPEMTVEKYAEMFKKAIANMPIIQKTTGANPVLSNVYIPFASGGALLLDDVTRYKVKISGHDSTIDVDVDIKNSKTIGKAIVLKRAEVRGTLTEKEETITDSEFLVFPELKPEKLEYRVAQGSATRKITVEKAEITINEVKNIDALIDNTPSVLNAVPMFNVSGINTIIVHTEGNGDDFTYYKLDLE